MRIIDGFHIRNILDETVAIPTRAASEVFSGVISLNELGRFLFERLYEDQTVESLIYAVIEQYDVDENTARSDILEFIDILKENNLLLDDSFKK